MLVVLPGLMVSGFASTFALFAIRCCLTSGAGGGATCTGFAFILESLGFTAFTAGRQLVGPVVVVDNAEFLATYLFPRLVQCDLFFFHPDFSGGLVQDFVTSVPAGLFGAGLSRLTSAAGFTPADMAALAAVAESGICFAVPRKSGFTTICRS